jgi:DNA-binding SARP family transcriptional activator
MSEAVDLGRIIQRSALLDRLRRVQPRLIALVAPAGFGKSTLVRQFVEQGSSFAICDCAHVEDDLDFARRIVSTLAEEEPERGNTLSQRQLLLGDASTPEMERVAIALAAWRDPAKSSIFVFENAERILDLPAVRDVFTRLLAERPEERTVVVCSRVALRIHLSRFAAPHQIVTMRADDLAFERSDLDELFKPLLDAATLDRMYTASLGWPIAVFLLARFAVEGRLSGLLERLNDVAFEELHDYLADEVIASLPKSLTDALFAAACVPSANATDLEIATGLEDAAPALMEFERASPFVRRSEVGEFTVHPLLSGMLTRHQLDRRVALLSTTALAYERRGDTLRAAELFLAIPDQEAASRALESVPVGDDRAPSMRYSQLLSSLDRHLVRAQPTLWSGKALFQMFATDCAQLLNETQYVWAALSDETPVFKKYYVIATRVLLLTYLGRFEEALAFLEQVAPIDVADAPLSREVGYKLYLRGTILARMGRVDEAESDLLRVLPFAQRMDAMASAVEMLLGSDIARIRGDAAQERDRIMLSLEYARRSELMNVVAFRLAEAAFSAWLQGDDRAMGTFADELQTIVDGYGIRGFAFFAGCARGDPIAVREADMLRWVLCGHLIAASRGGDNAVALEHARAAARAAEEYPNPFLQTLAALTLAELSPADEHADAYARALAYAENAGSAAVPLAVVAARDASGCGMLEPFIQRLRTEHATVVPRLEISVLTGTVRNGGKTVHLGERELALTVALSLRQQPISQGTLIEMLWPDSDDPAAANALYACLHRLRNRLGEDAVLRSADGLYLSDDATVDLWAIERRVACFRSHELADDLEYGGVMAVYQALRPERPSRYLGWEWFAQMERYLSELRCNLGLRLGRYCVRAGRHDEALGLAREMMARDPCDEGAREVAITAYLGLGDRAAALQQYRQYRSVLMEELRCEPSPAIAALVEVSADSAARKTPVRTLKQAISPR